MIPTTLDDRVRALEETRSAQGVINDWHTTQFKDIQKGIDDIKGILSDGLVTQVTQLADWKKKIEAQELQGQNRFWSIVTPLITRLIEVVITVFIVLAAIHFIPAITGLNP